MIALIYNFRWTGHFLAPSDACPHAYLPNMLASYTHTGPYMMDESKPMRSAQALLYE